MSLSNTVVTASLEGFSAIALVTERSCLLEAEYMNMFGRVRKCLSHPAP